MNIATDESTLVLVQIVFRHGIRAPDHKVSYPGDPYQDVTFEPFGRGQLTKEGRKQCYDYGKELRDRYEDFLGPDYADGDLEAHSSEVGRARMSLQLVLAGLYPPTDRTRVADDLNWHPVLYDYKPLLEDPLIGAMILKIVGSENHPEFNKSPNSVELISQIEERLKWKIVNCSQILMIYDIIKTQEHLGLEVPEWAKDIYPAMMREEVTCYMRHNMLLKDYLKDGCGTLMQKILRDMENKAQEDNSEGENAPKSPKVILYSGHDINIIALMIILDFPDKIWPQYVGNLTFELHKVHDQFYVKVIFMDGWVTETEKQERNNKILTLKVPNTENDLWTLSNLRKHVEKYLK